MEELFSFGFGLLFFYVILEASLVAGQDPGAGIEIVLLRHLALHEVKEVAEFVFSAQDVHPWEVVDSLIWL